MAGHNQGIKEYQTQNLGERGARINSAGYIVLDERDNAWLSTDQNAYLPEDAPPATGLYVHNTGGAPITMDDDNQHTVGANALVHFVKSDRPGNLWYASSYALA